MKRKLALVGIVLATGAALTACKEVDKNAVGAHKVEGTYNLYWFCDMANGANTLIYFEDVDGGDDEYTLIWPGACTKDGKQKDLSSSNPDNANEPGGDDN